MDHLTMVYCFQGIEVMQKRKGIKILIGVETNLLKES